MSAEAWAALLAIAATVTGGILSWVHAQLQNHRTEQTKQVDALRADMTATVANERVNAENVYARREDMATITAQIQNMSSMLAEVREDVHAIRQG